MLSLYLTNDYVWSVFRDDGWEIGTIVMWSGELESHFYKIEIVRPGKEPVVYDQFDTFVEAVKAIVEFENETEILWHTGSDASRGIVSFLMTPS